MGRNFICTGKLHTHRERETEIKPDKFGTKFQTTSKTITRFALQEPVEILKHDRSLGPYVTFDKDLKPIDSDGCETVHCRAIAGL